MMPFKKFLDQDRSFWAHVRSISQKVGYTERDKGVIKVPTLEQIGNTMETLALTKDHLIDSGGDPSDFCYALLEYFECRANALNNSAKTKLMDKDKAKNEFDLLKRRLKPICPLPNNKQKKGKKGPAYFTCIINMLIEENAKGLPCDYDPRELTTITRNSRPLRTLARWVDGAFPSAVNPIAIWEIKEYYHTTTFGSRVADGVYETLLDGMELAELREHEGIDVKHYLMVDDYYTWWDCGRSYLCRIFDMLHMGYVDEVLFGHEVIERLPSLVKEWVNIYDVRDST